VPSERVQAALDEFKAALEAEGMDPDTVDAQTRYILPSEITLGGNYADLQRLGASSLAGNTPDEVAGVVKPPQPIAEATFQEETGEAHAQLEGMGVTEGSGAATPAEATDDSASPPPDEGLAAMTKDELFEEAAARGVDVPKSATKAEIIDRIEGR
jgi:hypothetical protein